MAEYTAIIEVSIEAETDQEAYDIYCSGDWNIDGHTLTKWVNGFEVEVDESQLKDGGN